MKFVEFVNMTALWLNSLKIDMRGFAAHYLSLTIK